MNHYWTYKGQPYEPTKEQLLLTHCWGFVYRITHTASGKFYIGKKSHFSIRNKRKFESDWRVYMSSSEPLRLDIAQFGMSAFTFEVLELAQNPKELAYVELKHMFAEDILRKNCYNNAIYSWTFKRGAL